MFRPPCCTLEQFTVDKSVTTEKKTQTAADGLLPYVASETLLLFGFRLQGLRALQAPFMSERILGAAQAIIATNA